jgi:hypothetical protein
MDIQAKTRQCKITSYTFNDNIKDNLHLYWTTSTTIALLSIYVHTINMSQFNKESSPHHHQHNHYHNYLTYMHSPKISTSFGIYATNQHHNIITTQQLHTIYLNPSKGENTPYYDKHHIQHLSIIHTSSYNHIKLSTKDLPIIWS